MNGKKKFHFGYVLLLAACILLPGFSPRALAAANLLKNGDASQGLAYWTDKGGTWEVSTNLVDPLDGPFFGAGETAETELVQDVAVGKYAAGTWFQLTASCRDYSGSDTCIPTMIFLDKSGKTLLSLGNPYRRSEWQTVKVMARKPAGAVTLRVSLQAVRSSGSYNDAYFDNVKLIKSSSKDANLLSNGSGEYGMGGWTDPGDAWSAVLDGGNTLHKPKNGDRLMWPERKDLGETQVYQDVTVTSSQIGKTAVLSAWLANYDQAPHDQATLTITFLDSKGKKISSQSQSQRNPEWQKHTITAKIPKKTKKIRVTLSGRRFVGSDLDCYFDDVRLEIRGKTFKKVTVSFKKKGTCYVGEKKTLKAVCGGVSKASAFTWTSSYNNIAKVSKKGVVTFLQEGKVTIYATYKNTGVTGSLTFTVKKKT